MRTWHNLFLKNANNLDQIESDSVDLIVTSPPYPMIEMWDDIFATQNKQITYALNEQNGNLAFELMHQILDTVWNECFRVLKNGGFACINIGDATRTIDTSFAVYPNHARILQHVIEAGFTILPEIIWRKQTNSPNKFMGSGMLPAGAYVTLEHEYILILRKGSKREFKTEAQKQTRRESALFWEERNNFFSDIWFDIKGTRQNLSNKSIRDKSGAFPFDLAFRLILMYSVKNDTILDPFLGTGTTMNAAIASARNSIGFEIDPQLHALIQASKDEIINISNTAIQQRLDNHLIFVNERMKTDKPLKHQNIPYGFPVITAQEKHLFFNPLISTQMIKKNCFEVEYNDLP